MLRGTCKVIDHVRQRRGVTLVEVMFSIGIVSVGLLGVLLIIPVAGSRTTRGVVADRADRVGRNAIRDVDIRGMGQPRNWTRFDTATQNYVPFPSLPPGGPPIIPPGHATITSRSFCIDPLFIATYRESGVTVPTDVEFFPYYRVTNVQETRMQRISLRRWPECPPEMGMILAQAIEIFMSSDDLVFDRLPDPTIPPIQNFSQYSTKRQSEGQFSWLATLTPKQDTLVDGGTLAQNTDLYLLSIVVFHRRDMTMTMQKAEPSIEGPDNERLVEVSFDGAGYAGGEVMLRTRGGRPAEDLTVRSGDWVMLSARVEAPNHPIHFFRWYRVISADAGIVGTGAGPFTRNVTLQGTDWDRIATVPDTRTQATLMSNVVAVYEKTIRLETSSLWTGL